MSKKRPDRAKRTEKLKRISLELMFWKAFQEVIYEEEAEKRKCKPFGVVNSLEKERKAA